MESARGNHKGQQPQQEQSRKTSSFSDLFGDRKDSAISRGSVFHSVFSPPSSSYRSSASKGSGVSPFWASWMKDGNGDSMDKTNTFSGMGNQGKSYHGLNIEHFEEMELSSLGSSLYYGGQDICVHSPTSRAIGNSSISTKDGSEDPSSSNSALRGNWWQGSLYY